ncbi:hypothetical protein LPN01_13565 [Sphingomonas sp. A2-49]|uniref:hypothetical protein n=1 Tax=Sphingomonas sp. A2-49 TaxID=1391375 RepID=UPI0021D1D28B|nr:hypothetical protein [Sphingomonas sp. A2-49]MCU6455107.1 hypothetical protein [Sphingomonas sp. A2-49]
MKQPAPEPLKVVPRDIVEAMRVGLAGQTNAALMPRYGISYNTWRKVQVGEAIRRSVAERLEQRLRDTGSGGMQRSAHA